MAHNLRITDNVSPVILTNNTTAMLSNYTPRTPDQAVQAIENLGDGGELASVRYKNVTETIEVLALGSTPADAQAVITSINRLLEQARIKQITGGGSRIYLRLQVDSDSVAWRSEILTGRVELQENALAIWGNAKIPIRIHITRRFYWEHDLSTELQLASRASTTPATGGKGILNHDDGASAGNYIQIAAAQVAGDLPAPVKIQMQNDTGATQDYRNIYLACYPEGFVNSFNHVIQGEDVISGSTGSNADSSGGEYYTSTFSGTVSPAWTLDSDLLSRTQGNQFHLLTRFRSYTAADIYVTPRIRDATGLIDLEIGDEIKLPLPAVQLFDLGALSFPPGGFSASWNSTLTLVLTLRAATSVTVQIDFIQLFSTHSFRHLLFRNATLADNDQMIDDGLENLVYSVEGGDRQPVFSPRGTSIRVFPNQLQRVYILHDEGTTSPIGNVTTVSMWYRARRLNV